MAVIRVRTDYPTIQAAVDAALPGDEILVEGGVYRERVTVGKSFLSITGEKNAVLDGQWMPGTAFTLDNTSGVEIRSFIIKNFQGDGVDILGGGTSNAISQTRFFNIGGSGVKQDAGVSDSRVTGCSVKSAESGIYDLGHCLRAENCRILYCRTGVSCEESSADAWICRCAAGRNVIGIAAAGIRAQIKGNDVFGSRSGGINVTGAGCLVEGNDVRETITYDGISVAAENSTVRGNRVCKSGRYGIYVNGTGLSSILANEVNDNADIGILIEQQGNTVVGNRARGNGKFDLVRVRVRNTVRGNSCGRSLPPWLCEGCARSAAPDGESGAVPCPASALRVPEDYPTIQQAVDAAAPGGVICVESGVYREQVMVEKDGLRIIGKENTVLDGGGRLDVGFILNGASGVEIRSFRIENYVSFGVGILGGGGNVLARTGIRDIQFYGVYLDTATKDNRISESGAEGAYNGVYDFSSGLRIEKSRFSYNGNLGVYCFGTGTEITETAAEDNYDSGVACMGNGTRIRACRIARNLQDGVEIQGGGAVVEDSEICSNFNYGVMMNGSDGTARNNRLCSNGAYGIFSSNTGGNTVTGNRADGNGLNGIVVLDNNFVGDNTAHGNFIFDLVRVQTNSVFQNNDCEKCLPPWICCENGVPEAPEARRCGPAEEAATIVVPDDYATIQQAVNAAQPWDIILVKGGVYREQVTVTQSRIRIVGGDGAVLDGTGTLESGFVVQDAFGVEIRSFTVRNYTVYGVSAVGDSHEITFAGLAVVNCNSGFFLDRTARNCLIAACTVFGSGTVGINNRGINLRIEDCRISYNGSTAIVSYGDTVTILRNEVFRNFGNGILSQMTGSTLIAENRICENRVTALSARGVSAVRDNDVSRNFSNGIAAIDARSVVEGNRVCANTKGGISLYSGALAAFNEVRDNGGFGLNVAYGGNAVLCNTAFNNRDYDIAFSQSGSQASGNVCGKSVPPWICGGCRAAEENDLEEENAHDQA
ncbi:MAG: right-handed parallel beta-helix repeat-containing protein [Oscillospiraceae bacterium]|nr:right-handed parallel beta-helix repeat-containing protein [Oscillospiraceae bacterium]